MTAGDQPPARTLAMTLAGWGCCLSAAGLLGFLAYLIAVYAPGARDERIVADLLPLFGLIAGMFGVLGVLALRWTGARRRAWFWLLPVILSVLVEAKNAQDIPYDIARPTNQGPFLVTIVILAGALGVIAGGVVAFLEIRRGRAVWSRTGRVAWLAVAIAGSVVGGAATSWLAGTVPAGGPPVVHAPTTTGFLTTEGIAFVGSRLEIRHDEALGLIITNPGPVGHSFDIDSLGIHVQLAPNSSTAVAIRPIASGSLEFYCSVHGHRSAGMVGTISVL